MTKQVTLLGVGMGTPETLTLGGMNALEQADLVLGAPRLLAILPQGGGIRLEETRPDRIIGLLRSTPNWQSACVALSGDIGAFSGAKALLEKLREEPYRICTVPGIGTVQYLAAKLRRPWQDWRLASAHGVPCDAPSQLAQGGTVLFFTGGENTAERLCASLCAAGMEEAQVTVGERLSYPQERIVQGTASHLAGQQFHSLSVLLAEWPGGKHWPFANTGIPDEAFRRGGVPMTKQEVRAAALAKLGIAPGNVFYDIGAGTGSVSVEAALLAGGGTVYAVEQSREGAALIRENAASFGLHNIRVVEGRAPGALEGLPPPDAAFVGGSGGSLKEILGCLREKNAAVRLCVSCIALETLTQATGILGGPGYTRFQACQIAVARTREVGRLHLLTAQNPVFLVSAWGDAQ